ncbi:MAG: hypothetical protein ACYDGN_16220 [Acidimicrobiales bacterium]
MTSAYRLSLAPLTGRRRVLASHTLPAAALPAADISTAWPDDEPF